MLDHEKFTSLLRTCRVGQISKIGIKRVLGTAPMFSKFKIKEKFKKCSHMVVGGTFIIASSMVPVQTVF
jgi:hypothetical protein